MINLTLAQLLDSERLALVLVLIVHLQQLVLTGFVIKALELIVVDVTYQLCGHERSFHYCLGREHKGPCSIVGYLLVLHSVADFKDNALRRTDHEVKQFQYVLHILVQSEQLTVSDSLVLIISAVEVVHLIVQMEHFSVVLLIYAFD